jgi:hypothetical protein
MAGGSAKIGASISVCTAAELLIGLPDQQHVRSGAQKDAVCLHAGYATSTLASAAHGASEGVQPNVLALSTSCTEQQLTFAGAYHTVLQLQAENCACQA